MGDLLASAVSEEVAVVWIQPIELWPPRFARRLNVDGVAVVKGRVQSRELAVHHGANAVVSHLSVNAVREIEGRRTGR